ncbi:MAG: IclR family transcriptional regulator [Pseudomonadota bacterium]
MQNESSSTPETIQSVEVALRILETLVESDDDIGVTALAQALDMTKSKIHRHLRSLMALGYIAQTPETERYRPGAKMLSLGQAAARSIDLLSIAQPHLRKLRDDTGHAVALANVEEDGVRIVSTLPGLMQIDVGVRPGSLLGFTNSAQGKIALSRFSPDRLSAILDGPLPAATDYSLSTKQSLTSELDTLRQQGWATAANETVMGLNALASSVFDSEGRVIATIAIVGLVEYIKTPPSSDQITAVQSTAERISKELGYDLEHATLLT